MRRFSVPPPLTGPYALPPSTQAIDPSPATVNLVRSQVQALLLSSPAYQDITSRQRQKLARSLVKIAAYAAELIRCDWYYSECLGQRPVVRYKEVLQPMAEAQAAADDFRPAAASRVGQVTRETLRAISFPSFVADLVNGTFNAITNATIRQMESYTQLLSDVSKTVDQFMADNISDNQARDWLAERYPEYLQVRTEGDSPRLTVRPGAEDRPAPTWRTDLNLPGDVVLDEDQIEQVLIPAARRKLAQGRLQMLSSLVLMGMNRIVVTGGRIRAAMQFHIDTTDQAREQRATDFDFRTAASGQANFGMWSASASVSVAYVNSVRAESEAEMNLAANLTGDVEIQFRSDFFPVTRFANTGTIQRIQGHTAAPEANAPVTFAPPVQPLQPASRQRSARELPELRTASSPAPRPAAPQPVAEGGGAASSRSPAQEGAASGGQ